MDSPVAGCALAVHGAEVVVSPSGATSVGEYDAGGTIYIPAGKERHSYILIMYVSAFYLSSI